MKAQLLRILVSNLSFPSTQSHSVLRWTVAGVKLNAFIEKTDGIFTKNWNSFGSFSYSLLLLSALLTIGDFGFAKDLSIWVSFNLIFKISRSILTSSKSRRTDKISRYNFIFFHRVIFEIFIEFSQIFREFLPKISVRITMVNFDFLL